MTSRPALLPWLFMTSQVAVFPSDVVILTYFRLIAILKILEGGSIVILLELFLIFFGEFFESLGIIYDMGDKLSCLPCCCRDDDAPEINFTFQLKC